MFVDFRGSGVIKFNIGKKQPAAVIETFARFQAGFLSEDFHRISEMSNDFYDFNDFHGLP